MLFFDHPAILITIALISIPIYVSLAKMFWGERFDSLGETIRYLFTPDIISFFRGEYWDDWHATLKFNVILFLCLGWAAAVTELLARYVL